MIVSTTPLSELLNRRNRDGLSDRELGRRAGIGESTGTQYLGVRRSKSGRPREAPIPASVMESLDLSRPAADPLFRSATGGRIRVDNWRARHFAPAADRLGVPGLRIHDLRHTAASLMILSGATVKDVQAALGHASATMTLDLYAGWWDTGLDDIGERMDRLITSV